MATRIDGSASEINFELVFVAFGAGLDDFWSVIASLRLAIGTPSPWV
jgi:hypothetical protein